MEQENRQLLIVRYLSGEASHAEHAVLLEWLEAGAENRREFRALKDSYDLGRIATSVREADTTAQWEKLRKRLQPALPLPEPKHRNLAADVFRYAAAVVAGVVLTCAGYYMAHRTGSSDRQITRIETGVGERSKITLPDGSVVWLNSCSTISYEPDFDRNRDIALSGEAFFEVRKNPDHPFRVHSGEITYRVTGTSFNVYAFADDTAQTLMLVEGGVTLEYGKNMLAVKPGEVVEFDKQDRKFLVKHSDPALYTSWRSGELVFEQMSFGELAQRLERNFNVKFVFQNEQVRCETFGGSFRNYDTLETILKVIGTSTPIKYRIERDTVYIR